LLATGAARNAGVQRRAVEPFPGVRAGRDSEERWPAGLRGEPGQGGGAVLGAHAALEGDRVVPEVAERTGDRLQVPGPVGEHQAVPALAEGGRDVGDDLAGALVAGDEVLVDDGHPARRGRAGSPAVAVGGRVEVQHWRWSSAGGAARQHVHAVGLPGRGDGVPDRADLHADQVVELVAPVGGGGQPEPPPGGDLPDGVLERGGRDVVAFIGHDQPVPGGQLRDVVAAGQGLEGNDVDGAAELGPAAAELPGLDAEELSDPGPSLVGQGLAVDQDERGDPVGGDDRAGHHGLPCSGRRY
jgi:hypothetical protein